MGIFDRWKKKEGQLIDSGTCKEGSDGSVYEKAMKLLSSSDFETKRKGREMMCEYAWGDSCRDVRVYMWMAKEFESQGGYGAAADWYGKALRAGVAEAKAGYLRCNNPYHVNSYCSIDGSRGCGTPALREAERTEEKQRTDYKNAIEKLESDISHGEALKCLKTISQIAGAYGCVVPEAQVWMGNFSETVEKDLKNAADWFKKASDGGSGEGARCYADMLMSGRGITKNQDEAMKYYILAADRGQMEAQFVVGQYYQRKDDKVNARKYYKLSADSGFQPAAQQLQRLEKGDSTNTDDIRNTYQPVMRHKYAELIRRNHLDQDGLVEFYAAIFQPEDFCTNTYRYCNQQYGDKGMEKLAFEYCMTSFYGAICTVALWNGTDQAYENGSAWDTLYKTINVEFTDSNAERLLGTKQGEDKAENIFAIIQEFIHLAQIPLQQTKLDKEVSLFIMELAYKMGFLVAKKELELPNLEFTREYLGENLNESDEPDDLEDDDYDDEDEDQELESPQDFYKTCLAEFHEAAEEAGFANHGLIFIPELISMGSEAVLAFLNDSFFAQQFGSNPGQYYYVIMSLSLQTGIAFGEKWHKDFEGLKKGYVQKIIDEGPADEANRIMADTLKIRGNDAQNQIYHRIYEKWADVMAPYWQIEDSREFIFKSMMAAYQTGISMILEKYGF